MVHPLAELERRAFVASNRCEVEVVEEQAEVPFYGTSILAVKLSDGRVAAVFSSLCAAPDLARQPQVRRVRADEVIAESLLPCGLRRRVGCKTLRRC